jgi:isoquinoline 1-oxidoreductase subunit beta
MGARVTGRRRFLGYLLAAPTLVAAAQLGEETLAPRTAAGAPLGTNGTVPSNPQPADVYDLEDALTDAAMPTSHLIAVQVNRDGTASFALPRCEVGQGITTSIAMLIAEEMDLPVEKVHVGLSDARPELVFNQLTGGSNTLNSMYHPVRIAAAIAKGRLLDAAAEELDRGKEQLTSRAGVISVPGGRSLSYGELATKAASLTTKPVAAPPLKPESEFKIIGKPQRRVDALDIVTGRKQFTTDLQVPDAKPTMVCRPPTINGTVKTVNNADEVRKMPGITDVAPVSTGVAVRGETFGQCIDAVNALKVTWGPGTKDTESDETVLQELKLATPPIALQPVPGTKVLDADFAFAFQNNSALEPRSAVADVKNGHAEIWARLKIPIVAQDQIAKQIKMPHEAITVHVMTGGGSFGSSLFPDHAVEAAEISKKMGKPVKLMWHRADDVRQGRVHPMSYAKIRAIYGPQGVLGFEQHHASVRTDFSHGFGEAVSSSVSRTPLAGLGVSEVIFETTAISPYNFGPQKSLLTETHQSEADNQWHGGFNTSSMRNVYSPDVTAARELFVDLLAHAMGEDPFEFRLRFVKNDKFRTVLEKVAKEGNWGRPLPRGFAQGIGLHHEYKQVTAAFVELDCRPETVNRKMFMAATGPRVTRAVFATIPGKVVVNPLGMEAQLQGGFHDGIALALTSSLHLKNGHYVEASWDNYAYTREWNAPTQGVEVHILPPDPDDKVAGAGEAAVAASKAATACAYQRAMGKQQPQPVRGPADMWPANHKGPLHFEEYPTVPPLPPPPTDGLKYTY